MHDWLCEVVGGRRLPFRRRQVERALDAAVAEVLHVRTDGIAGICELERGGFDAPAKRLGRAVDRSIERARQRRLRHSVVARGRRRGHRDAALSVVGFTVVAVVLCRPRLRIQLLTPGTPRPSRSPQAKYDVSRIPPGLSSIEVAVGPAAIRGRAPRTLVLFPPITGSMGSPLRWPVLTTAGIGAKSIRGPRAWPEVMRVADERPEQRPLRSVGGDERVRVGRDRIRVLHALRRVHDVHLAVGGNALDDVRAALSMFVRFGYSYFPASFLIAAAGSWCAIRYETSS